MGRAGFRPSLSPVFPVYSGGRWDGYCQSDCSEKQVGMSAIFPFIVNDYYALIAVGLTLTPE